MTYLLGTHLPFYFHLFSPVHPPFLLHLPHLPHFPHHLPTNWTVENWPFVHFSLLHLMYLVHLGNFPPFEQQMNCSPDGSHLYPHSAERSIDSLLLRLKVLHQVCFLIPLHFHVLVITLSEIHFFV